MDKDREKKFIWGPGDIIFVEGEKAQKMVDDLVRRLNLDKDEKPEEEKKSENSDTKA